MPKIWVMTHAVYVADKIDIMKEIKYSNWDLAMDKIDDLPGCVVAFAMSFIFMIVWGLFNLFWNHCGVVDKDELLLEKIDLPNRTYIYIIHSWKCSEKCMDRKTGESKMLWFKDFEEKKKFVKLKYYVYDYCIDEIHAKELDAISNANIADYDDDYDRNPDNMNGYVDTRKNYDLSSRDYSIYYSNGDSLTLLPEGKRGVGYFKILSNQ